MATLKLQFPAGITGLKDINGIAHVPDTNGQINMSDLPENTDVGQLLRVGYTIVSV